MSQKNGIAKSFTISGPMKGTIAIKAVIPAKNCVKTPRRIVTSTTTFFSTPKYNATIMAPKNNNQINKLFRLYLKNVFSLLLLRRVLSSCFLLIFLLIFFAFAIVLPKSDE